MKFKDRLTIFIFGVILGAILVSYIKSQQARDRSESPALVTVEDIQRAAAPAIYQAYAERGVPMQSDFIEATKFYAHPEDGHYYRVLILQGQEPEQTLRIEETVRKSKPNDAIVTVRVMAADRLNIQLRDGAASSAFAQAIRPWGYRLLQRGLGADEYIISLGSQAPETVTDALERVRGLDLVVSAEPVVY